MSETAQEKLQPIDWFLLMVTTAVLVFAGLSLRDTLKSQNAAYDSVINHAIRQMDNDSSNFSVASAAVLAFSRAKDFANTKTASDYIGFLLVFTGALYLLKVFNLSYKLKAEKTPVGNITFESASPGLVMITLGVAIILAVLFNKTKLDYEADNTELKKTIEQVKKALASLDEPVSNQQQSKVGVNRSVRPGTKKTVSPQTSDANFLDIHSAADTQTMQVRRFAAALAEKLKKNPNAVLSLTGQSTAVSTPVKLIRARNFANALKTLLVQMGADASRIKVTTYGESPHDAETAQWKDGVKAEIDEKK